MSPGEDNFFERHPKTTLAAVWAVYLLLFTVCAEIALGKLSGLGHPVLFHSHPAYGYRLKPNQETWRFGGAHFKINNLGLRAERDWDSAKNDKILFLGDSVTYGGNHISNDDLFSERAVDPHWGLSSGNAGVPNWGVENVYGLVVEAQFMPASTYVSTFIENDFYRGLQRGHELPWVKFEPPRFALEELADFLWHKFVRRTRQANQRLLESEHAEARVARAAAKLEALDTALKARGYRHLILISPTRREVLGQQGRDPMVQAELEKHGLKVVYLLDEPIMRQAPLDERRSWFQDTAHLTAKGHAVWAGLIGRRLGESLPAHVNSAAYLP